MNDKESKRKYLKKELDSRKLRLAKEALEVCNKFHQQTGRNKIPLDEVADHLGITAEEIQDAFDELVRTGEIGDDGDRDHMNYEDSGVLIDLIERLLLEIESEEENEDEEEEIIEKEANYYT